MWRGVYVRKCCIHSSFGYLSYRRDIGRAGRKSVEPASSCGFVHSADSVPDGFTNPLPVARGSGETVPDTITDAEPVANDETVD